MRSRSSRPTHRHAGGRRDLHPARSARIAGGLAAAAAALLGGAVLGVVGVASSASAHVGVDLEEIVAGESTSLGFSFGHGCQGSPTNRLAIQVPDGIVNAQPHAHPGWDIAVEREDLAEPAVIGHGQEVTDRPAVITFTARAGEEVPDGIRDTVRLSFTAPEAEGRLVFKVVQGCVEGESAWIDEWDGTGEEPEHLAPSVMVVAAAAGDDAEEGGHGSATTDLRPAVSDATGADGSAGGGAAGGALEDDAGEDGGDGDGLAIAALVVGGLGLVAGGAALARSRPAKLA